MSHTDRYFWGNLADLKVDAIGKIQGSVISQRESADGLLVIFKLPEGDMEDYPFLALFTEVTYQDILVIVEGENWQNGANPPPKPYQEL